MKLKTLIGLLVLVLLLAAGCAQKGPEPVSPEDNPQHHYVRGMENLQEGDLDVAQEKFDRALYLDDQYSPAQAGMGLVLSIKAEKRNQQRHKKADISSALELMENSLDNAENINETFIARTTAIRNYTHAKPQGWLQDAQDIFQEANQMDSLEKSELPYYRGRPACFYYMGKAYMEGYKFRKAQDMFSRTLSTGAQGKWQPLANEAYQKVQKIVRASSHHSIGKVAEKIAVKNKVNRADVASLLIDEVKLDKLFAGRIPVESELASQRAEFIPADIVESPFKSEIETVLKWDVRGLTPTYSKDRKAYLFHPQKPLKRYQLAMILEDILIKLTQNKDLATKYVGTQTSPFNDVKPSSAWFNAVMTVTSRDLMTPELSGEFKPRNYVNGPELLLSVFKLRDTINIY